jgi:hypothetical protein
MLRVLLSSGCYRTDENLSPQAGKHPLPGELYSVSLWRRMVLSGTNALPGERATQPSLLRRGSLVRIQCGSCFSAPFPDFRHGMSISPVSPAPVNAHKRQNNCEMSVSPRRVLPPPGRPRGRKEALCPVAPTPDEAARCPTRRARRAPRPWTPTTGHSVRSSTSASGRACWPSPRGSGSGRRAFRRSRCSPS